MPVWEMEKPYKSLWLPRGFHLRLLLNFYNCAGYDIDVLKPK